MRSSRSPVSASRRPRVLAPVAAVPAAALPAAALRPRRSPAAARRPRRRQSSTRCGHRPRLPPIASPPARGRRRSSEPPNASMPVGRGCQSRSTCSSTRCERPRHYSPAIARWVSWPRSATTAQAGTTAPRLATSRSSHPPAGHSPCSLLRTVRDAPARLGQRHLSGRGPERVRRVHAPLGGTRDRDPVLPSRGCTRPRDLARVSLRRLVAVNCRASAAVAQLARASACHAEGRGFESLQPLSEKPR